MSIVTRFTQPQTELLTARTAAGLINGILYYEDRGFKVEDVYTQSRWWFTTYYALMRRPKPVPPPLPPPVRLSIKAGPVRQRAIGGISIKAGPTRTRPLGTIVIKTGPVTSRLK